MYSKCSVSASHYFSYHYYLWYVGWTWSVDPPFAISALNHGNWDSNQKALSLWLKTSITDSQCFLENAWPLLLCLASSLLFSSYSNSAFTWLLTSVVISPIFNSILAFCLDNVIFPGTLFPLDKAYYSPWLLTLVCYYPSLAWPG